MLHSGSSRPFIPSQGMLTIDMLPSHTAWSAQAPSGQKAWPFCVPAGIQVAVAIRPDLKHFDLQRVTDRIVFYLWWERRLHLEYPEIEWRLSEADVAFLASYSMAQFLDDGGKGLSYCMQGNWPTVIDQMPGFLEHSRQALLDSRAIVERLPKPLCLIWTDRPDLQSAHDIECAEGRISFLRWWFNFGHKEHPRVEWRLGADLLEIDAHGEGRWPWPHVLDLIVKGRPDLADEHFAPVTQTNWFNGLLWWHRSGCDEFAVGAWSVMSHLALRKQLHERAAAFAAEPVPNRNCVQPTPYAAYMVWSIRPDLQHAFDLQQKTGCDQFLAWWAQHGLHEYAGVGELFEDPAKGLPGLNILGYARSVIGIAEDVRMAARAARRADIAHLVIDAPIPGPAKLDDSLNPLLAERPRWPVSLYCLPPTEIIRLGMEGGKPLLNSGAYNIGAWHWELPVWPDHLMGVINSVDEIWVYSEFVRKAFADKTSKTVHKMPMAVELPAHSGAKRAQFRLPPNQFLFLIMFDGNSWLSRKNPLGAVRAFKAAFASNPNVGLVIKAISLNRTSAAWQAVEQELQGDERVFVIDHTLSRVELAQLMASCDAYVSLHRSEGFGRIIAEAMLLGLPTVTTAFSGNTDFCTSQTSHLVHGPMVPLSQSDYLLYESQYWCDPDIDQARAQLQHVFEHRAQAKLVASAGQRLIQSRYSIEAVAQAYRHRLHALRAQELA